MTLTFLDTNVLLRHLSQDHPDQSPCATAFMAEVEAGNLRVRLNDLVVAETVFTLERHYKVSKRVIVQSLLPLIALSGVVLPNKDRYSRVFDYYVRLDISFADAFHAVTMEESGVTDVVSFDRHFDRVPGLRRVEP